MSTVTDSKHNLAYNTFNGKQSMDYVALYLSRDYTLSIIQALKEAKDKCNDDGRKIKLEAGWGVTYTTGIPHEVAEVTRGCRNAAVFWTKSHIKDDSIRSIYSQAHRLEQMLEVTDVLTLEQQETHPFAIARNLRSQLQRKFCK